MYGSLNLTVLSPVQTFTEPLTLAEVKEYLRIPARSPVDSDEDAQLNSFIMAAREQAEAAQNRDLVRKQWDLEFDYWPSVEIALRAPLISVDLVQYIDSANAAHTVSASDYQTDKSKEPGIALPAYGKTWPAFTPRPSSAVLIRFTSGGADLPAMVRAGMLLLISHWYNGRLPFEPSAAISQYPYTIDHCLSFGAVPRVP